MSARPELPPLWKVKIARHAVMQRWIIRAQSCKLPAPSFDYACTQVIRWAHADAGIPPWKPCVRESLAHTTATRLGAASVTTTAGNPSTAQLVLFDDRIAA
ncbi:MAG TPA: hypothetical protein VKG38_03535 [Solirubrobacteraceae bacterium]|nr:hypothetical protein [Solirubrobacteraceae bacterium]